MEYRKSGAKEIPIDPKLIAWGLLGLILLFLAFRSFVVIDATEQGVVLRLGKAKDDLLTPGLHFVVPLVDRVYRVETEIIHKEEFGYRSAGGSITRTSYSEGSYDEEALLVTGDLNMAEVEWSVQYKISDPLLYLFMNKEPVRTLRDLSESVMCQVVGNRSVYEVLTVGRTEVELEAKTALQETLETYQTGLRVVTLKLQNVLPPDKVKPSYNEVNEAEQYREKLVNQAQEQYNAVIPKAMGEAKQRLEQAEGYRAGRVNQALGEANKFISVYEAYALSKDVTKKRLYLESMTEILQSLDNVVLVDEDLRSVLPMLNLDKGTGVRNANQ